MNFNHFSLLEPMGRIGLPTYSLRKSRSTTEPHRQNIDAKNFTKDIYEKHESSYLLLSASEEEDEEVQLLELRSADQLRS